MEIKMRQTLAVLASLPILGAGSMSLAADGVAKLDKPEGTVMVNKGSGYLTHKGSLPLNEGDSVVTLDRSSAEIVFSDGCRAQLKANSMMVISLNPGCKAPIIAINPPAAPGAAVGGSTIAPESAAIVSALAGVGAYWLFDSGNDDKPISGE